MNVRRVLLLAASHLTVLAVGFALGIYALPLLTAPPAPSVAELGAAHGADRAAPRWVGSFRRDLKDSDALHWGEGEVTVSRTHVTLQGELAPGPDYKLYLSPEFVETEADFERLKPRMQRVGDVRTFRNFIVELPEGVDPSRYGTVVVWCESFGQFISAARYR